MVGSTLPGWMTILLVGGIFVVMLGYFNHYVPKTQQERAQEIKKRSYRTKELYVKYDTRINRFWYLISSTLISMSALVAFIIGDFEVLSSKTDALGLVGMILDVVLIVVGFLFVDFVLILVTLAAETRAIESTKDHYWRAYGVMMEPKE